MRPKGSSRHAAHCERLSALDASFLEVETENAPMHVAAVLVFDGEPLLDGSGRLSMERLRPYVRRALGTCERYRQRLEYVPAVQHPVWVDDDHFDLDFHVRRASVPSPGSERELKTLAGRILSVKLDRSRPLWEMYFVEGLADNRVAAIIKAHHCMVDGVGGMQLLMALLRATPDSDVPNEDVDWTPRPIPHRRQLLRDELRHRVEAGKQLVRSLNSDTVRKSASGVWSTVNASLPGLGTDTGFAVSDKSPYRRFDWARFHLDDVKAVKATLGGTVNDVVLAVTTGAARRHLQREDLDPSEIENLRAVLPVHTGSPARDGAGNEVAMWLADLPVDDVTPRDRMRHVIQGTSELKDESHQEDGAKLLEDLSDVATRHLLSSAFKLATRIHAFDLIITNVRGPSFPLYLLGARLQAVYPVVPLLPNQTLGIALFSYDGHIHWGLNADWESFPAVARFVRDLEASFEELRRSARQARARSPSARGEPSARGKQRGLGSEGEPTHVGS